MMNEKQIYRRMNECFESDYKNYEHEAEWYGSDDPKEWMFYIPSQAMTVKMIMEEKSKRIMIYEQWCGKEDFEYVGNYSW